LLSSVLLFADFLCGEVWNWSCWDCEGFKLGGTWQTWS